MNTIKLFAIALIATLLAACGGGGGGGGSTVDVPGAPTAVAVTAGATIGTTASVSFTAPTSDGGSAITGYSVTANPGNIAASGTSSPITVTGLTAGTDYTFSVTANNSAGSSAAATATNMSAYKVVETFYEPMTQPDNSIFTGSFTYDSISQTVTDLKGSLTESMTGTPMTTVTLDNQLSAVSSPSLGGVLVTTFALNTENTFSGGGFTPGEVTVTYGNSNAYAMIFVNSTNPTATLTSAQLGKLAYADCTPGGMMGTTCMTGTSVAGYGTVGTMGGYPLSQVITPQ